MIPYYFFGLFSILLSELIIPDFIWYKEVLKMLICTKALTVTYISHNFWFLMCMFVTCIFCWILNQAAKKFQIRLLWFSVPLLILSFITAYTGIELPFTIDISLLGSFFVIIGYEAKPFIDRMLRAKWITRAFVILVCGSLYVFCVKVNPGHYYMYVNQYGNFWIAQVGACIGSIVFILFMSFLVPILKMKKQPIKAVEDYILWVSDRTAPLFPIHLIVYYFLRPFIYSNVSFQPGIVMFLITLIIILPVTNLIYKYVPIATGEIIILR